LIVDEEEEEEEEEAHGTLNRIMELNKTLTDSIRKRHTKEDSALCKNKKKDVILIYSIFQHVSIN
jgi:hypothetical protein